MSIVVLNNTTQYGNDFLWSVWFRGQERRGGILDMWCFDWSRVEKDFNGGEERAYFFTIVIYTPSVPNYMSLAISRRIRNVVNVV